MAWTTVGYDHINYQTVHITVWNGQDMRKMGETNEWHAHTSLHVEEKGGGRAVIPDLPAGRARFYTDRRVGRARRDASERAWECERAQTQRSPRVTAQFLPLEPGAAYGFPSPLKRFWDEIVRVRSSVRGNNALFETMHTIRN